MDNTWRIMIQNSNQDTYSQLSKSPLLELCKRCISILVSALRLQYLRALTPKRFRALPCCRQLRTVVGARAGSAGARRMQHWMYAYHLLHRLLHDQSIFGEAAVELNSTGTHRDNVHVEGMPAQTQASRAPGSRHCSARVHCFVGLFPTIRATGCQKADVCPQLPAACTRYMS